MLVVWDIIHTYIHTDASPHCGGRARPRPLLHIVLLLLGWGGRLEAGPGHHVNISAPAAPPPGSCSWSPPAPSSSPPPAPARRGGAGRRAASVVPWQRASQHAAAAHRRQHRGCHRWAAGRGAADWEGGKFYLFFVPRLFWSRQPQPWQPRLVTEDSRGWSSPPPCTTRAWWPRDGDTWHVTVSSDMTSGLAAYGLWWAAGLS